MDKQQLKSNITSSLAIQELIPHTYFHSTHSTIHFLKIRAHLKYVLIPSQREKIQSQLLHLF